MKKGIKSMAVMCAAMLCLTGTMGCSLLNKDKKEDYGLKGSPVDDSKSTFVLNGDFAKEGYSISYPITLYSDKTIAVTYAGKNNSIISLYNYVDGTSKEKEVEAGSELISTASNGNLLVSTTIDKVKKFSVYNSELEAVLSGEDLGTTQNVIMSDNGEYLVYTDDAAKNINMLKISDKSIQKIYSADSTSDATLYVSKVSADAGVISFNQITTGAEVSNLTFLYDVKSKSAKQVEGENVAIETSNDVMMDIHGATIDNNAISYATASDFISGNTTTTYVSKSEEMNSCTINKEKGYMVTAVVNGKDSEYTQGIHIRFYDLKEGKLTKSIIAPASDIFNVISENNDLYSNDNDVSWLPYVTIQNTAIEYNESTKQVVVGIKDAHSSNVIVWNCDETAAEDGDEAEVTKNPNSADNVEGTSEK